MSNTWKTFRAAAPVLLVLLILAQTAGAYPGYGKKLFENLRFTEDEEKVTVCYDLNIEIARVKLVAFVNGKDLPVTTVSGDVGIVFGPDKELCVVWNLIEDYPEGLDDRNVTLDLEVTEYKPPAGEKPPERPKIVDPAAISRCMQEKSETRFRAERDDLLVLRNEYSLLLNADQAPYLDMLQKVKVGVPKIKGYDRDREGRQVPLIEMEPLSERERTKFVRELDRQIEKAERSPNSVISIETRRAKDKFEKSADRFFSRISSSCAEELGVKAEKARDVCDRSFAHTILLPPPFSFIKRDKNWE